MIDALEAYLPLIILAFVALFALLFAIYLVAERDSREAARRTSQRAVGTTTGVFGVVMVVLVEGLHILAEVPGVVMGLIGLGSIFAGFSLEIAAAIMLVSYIMLAGIRGE